MLIIGGGPLGMGTRGLNMGLPPFCLYAFEIIA